MFVYFTSVIAHFTLQLLHVTISFPTKICWFCVVLVCPVFSSVTELFSFVLFSPFLFKQFSLLCYVIHPDTIVLFSSVVILTTDEAGKWRKNKHGGECLTVYSFLFVSLKDFCPFVPPILWCILRTDNGVNK